MTPHDEAETLGALLVAICGRPARPVRMLAPRVSEPVAAIVMRALELDPAKRYATADQLLDALTSQLPFGTKLEGSLLRPAG